MKLQENPFYILDVSVRATKQEILAAAEDKSLFEDFETVENAKNALLDSSRRLEAELAWFPSASDADCDVLKKFADPTCLYYELLRNWISGDVDLTSRSFTRYFGEREEVIKNLEFYDKLNVKLLIFNAKDYTTGDNWKILGKDILQIILEYEMYCQERSKSLCAIINKNRIEAGIPTVTSDDVAEMLDRRRDSIFASIVSVLNKQASAASRFAMVYLAWYGTNGMKERGALLTEKLFEWYEISNQEVLISTHDCIQETLNEIEKAQSDAERLSEIEQVGRNLRTWVDLTQVLHCFYRTKGKEYEKTLELLSECRRVGIFLNNKCERPDLALKLAVTVKNSKAFLFYKERRKQAEEDIELLQSEADKREQMLKYETQLHKDSKVQKVSIRPEKNGVKEGQSGDANSSDGGWTKYLIAAVAVIALISYLFPVVLGDSVITFFVALIACFIAIVVLTVAWEFFCSHLVALPLILFLLIGGGYYYFHTPTHSTSVSESTSKKNKSSFTDQLTRRPKQGVDSQYVSGEPYLNEGGYSTLTVDNLRNDEPVFVRLWDVGESPVPVRTFTIAAHGKFLVENLSPGTYEVRYKYLYENDEASKGSKSDRFMLQETATYNGVTYSEMTLTLYKVRNGNMKTQSISADDV